MSLRAFAPLSAPVLSLLVAAAGSTMSGRAAVPAPSVPAYAPAESAAVARAAWASMRQARAAGDSRSALEHAARAQAAWPGQWVYAHGLAAAAARAGDAATLVRALGALEDLGAGPDFAADTTLLRFARARAPLALERVVRQAARGTTAEVAFRFPAADSAFWPEGLAFDAARGDFYVTGVREGRIARVDPAGQVHDFARVAGAGWAALGVAVDAERGRLWIGAAALPQAAGYAAADSGRGAILAFDLASGREAARHELPTSPGGHVPGDVVVTPQGTVYVTDSGEPAIWRIHEGRLERFATDPGFRSLQGQALGPDGSTLYVADHAHGLAAVDLGTRAVTWLRPPPRTTVLGIDGMAWHDGGLIAVQNGLAPPRIVWIDVAEDERPARLLTLMALPRDLGQADEPTLLAVAGSGRVVYVANSQWEKHDAGGRRRPGTVLGAPVGLVVPPALAGGARRSPGRTAE